MATPAPQQIVYGRTAYEGFAKAIALRMGLKVQIDDGASARIDANGVIQMPGMHTYQTAEEFAVTCGVVVHEMAHQFYKSHQTIDPNRSRLEHDCLNAVLDVADETWLSEWFRRYTCNARPGELLDAAGADALNRNFKAYCDWNNADTHAWKVLCTGIFIARSRPCWHLRKLKRWNASECSHRGVNAWACWNLLRKARLSAKQDPAPTLKRFKKLITLAQDLAELLKSFAPPAGAPTPSTSPLAGALAKGSATPNGVEATAQQGEDVATGNNGGGEVGGKGAGNGPSKSSIGYRYDANAFSLLAPSVQRVADRIATDGDGLLHTDGLSSGPVLGQAHRLVTDGQCLARWQTNDNADGVSVSVLLDCSGSMTHVLPQCAGIARSFAVGMRTAGEVQSLAFGDGVEESDFSRVRDMGGTATDAALRKAVDWLCERPGQRWIVLVTDGTPNDRVKTERVCREAVAQGIHLLSVGLGQLIPTLGATCVAAKDPAHLAIELDAAAQLIERGA